MRGREGGGEGREEMGAGVQGLVGLGGRGLGLLPWEGVEAAPSVCCVDGNGIYPKELL